MVGTNHDHSELLDSSPRSGALYVVDFKALASGTQVTYHVRSDVPAREAVQDRIREILYSRE